jgi:peroxiredoxin family protein
MSRTAQASPAEPARLARLAIVVSRGTSNNLFQVATLVRAATALEAHVDVLFQDDALLKLDPNRLNEPEWSAAYATVASSLDERLRAADFSDMHSFLRDAKEHGDVVHYWASAETLGRTGVRLDRLTPLLDDALTEAEFVQKSRSANALLAF